MPHYTYKCAKCNKETDQFRKISEASPSECAHCGHKDLSQVISAPASIRGSGSGWYGNGGSR